MNNENNDITPNDIFSSQVPNTAQVEPAVSETPTVETVSQTEVSSTPVVEPVVTQTVEPTVEPAPEVKAVQPRLENNILSPWAYIGYNLVFSIPIIGLILLIVFAVDKDTYNLNRRNYARSMLYIMIIAVIATIVLSIVFATVFAAMFESLKDNMNTMPTGV